MQRLEIFFAFLFAILLTLLVFWKIPLKNQVPFPGDLLVGRFFPGNTQAWEGYPLGVPYKEFISADTIRQTYPWRKLAIDQMKQGELPWWNPYAFSGTPLLANLQTSAFYPLNFIFWLTDFNQAWVILVLLQPVLAITFTYLFARSLKISPLASLFAGMTFAFSGFMIVWFELNTVGHSAVWLPLILWTLNKGAQNRNYYLLTPLAFVSSIFAGHIQTSLYIFLVAGLYQLAIAYKHIQIESSPHKKHLINWFIFSVVVGLCLSLVQLIPSYELYSQSPRSQVDSDIFSQFLIPPKHLITFLVPNYFGNPASNNFFGQDYGEFMAYFGVAGFVLALTSITTTKKKKTEQFFVFVFFLTLLFAVKNPIAYLPEFLKLPILSSSAASRLLFLTQFSGAILAAYGLDKCMQHLNAARKSMLAVFFAFSVLWIYTGANYVINSDPVIKAQSLVSLRNMVIPSATFSILVSMIILNQLLRNKHREKIQKLLPLMLLVVPPAGFSIFANKYLPFSEQRFMFPDSPPFSYLIEHANQDRFFGDYTASVTSNIWMPYEVYGVEGYDSLYLERYGTLLAAAQNNGEWPQKIPRSDANLASNQDDFYRQRLQDLLGVKYILDKNDHPQSDWEPDVLRFPDERYQLLWQENKFKIYENSQAFPRTFLVPTYEIIESDQDLLNRFFDEAWDPQKSILLETSPQSYASPYELPFEKSAIRDDLIVAEGTAEVKSYHPNRMVIQISNPKPQFLFVSDGYYPGWKAYLDGNEVQIFRANFSFRGIPIPTGDHTVELVYEPFFQQIIQP